MLQTVLNNRYQILKEIGYGGFGTTYLAKDTQTANSLCAIKKLNPDHADLQTAQMLFKREADALLRLQEIDQVPKFIDYFNENELSYIVEEYIEGSPLDSLLFQQWNVQNIIIFLWDILSVVQLLHKRNIVHRDIKPSNLIQRKKDNKFTIIDFGAIKELDASKPEEGRTCIVHRGYTPIEQSQGYPQLNSDIYALGMTAIQLLTGKSPKEHIRDNLDRVLSPEASSYPPLLINILNKMVRTDYKQRYQSVEEVLKDLGKVIYRSDPVNYQNPVNHENKTNWEEFLKHLDEIDQQSLVSNNSVNNNVNNNIKHTNHSIQPSNSRKKLWYIPLILIVTSLLVIGSELINPSIRTFYYQRQGNSLLEKGDAQQALGRFYEATKLQPHQASAWEGRGDALFTLRRYSGALEAYEKAIALEPNNLKAINNKGKVLYKQGKFKKAIAVHQQALKIDKNDAEALSSLGSLYLSLNQLNKAIESFERAEKLQPDNPTIWLQKGIVLNSLGRTEEAQNFYQETLKIYDELITKNNNPSVWTDRGFVLMQLQDFSDAFSSYEHALLLNPNFYEALLGKANALVGLKKYSQALEIFNRTLEMHTKDEQVWYDRGNLLTQAFKEHQQAIASFDRAIQLNPNFYPAWLGKGLALMSLKRYPDSLEALDRAKELNSQDPFIWVNRGMVLEGLEEYEQALASYEKAANELNFPPAKDYLDKLPQKLN